MDKTKVDYKLYLVTDRQCLNHRDLCACIEEAILGGVTLIQLREKSVSTLEFYETAKKVKAVADKHKVPLIINDRLDIAMAVNADGLHIGQDDMPLEVARKLLGQDKLIGVSVFCREEALLAQEQGADYLGVGAIFSTPSKSDAKYVDLMELKQIKETVNIPVVGIGGINESNLHRVLETGVDGVSVISAILAKENCQKAAANLREIMAARW
ncbi:Thiamine-phosphate synthase [Sporomusa carbonis]|uniref:thiamine phosphate synthase n=1 Tax=Sporomusa carbonis TaxID=3076075 RepID=UPI003A6B29F2